MIIARSSKDLAETIQSWKNDGQTIGFVPTMGALHEGHLSLIKIAKSKADKIVASIFVNPTQFAPHEDFDSYPREEEKDAQQVKAAGVDLLYVPTENDIYPAGVEEGNVIRPGQAAQGLETDDRPHFFDGVVDVVSRLFNQVDPDCAIFGEKDFQQLQVIREMSAEQKLGIDIIGAPIIRDGYGLALSSRNAYLSPEELEIARMLNQIIYNAAHDIRDKQKSAEEVCKEAQVMLMEIGFDKVDYVEKRWNRILVAAWLRKTRLIDNVQI